LSRTLRIAPSILSADFGRLAEEVAAATEAGADWIHVDVMDGQFVPNLSIGPPVVSAVRKATQLPLDVHLMIQRPEAMLEPFRDAGADGLTVHLEGSTHLQRTLARIRELGLKAGVALNPHTPASLLEYVLDDLDLVLVMTVNPGFGSQTMIPSVLQKVKRLRRTLDGREKAIDIEVDGGIHPATVAQAAAAGATVFVAGSGVFMQPDYVEAIRALRSGALAGAGLDFGA